MPSRAPCRALAALGVLTLAVALVGGGCAGPFAGAPTPIAASDQTQTVTRSVSDFSSVSVTGGLNLVVAAGPATQVQVIGPSNVVPLVQTSVAGTELLVTVGAPGFTSGRPVTVKVSAPKILAVSLDGGANGTMESESEMLAVSVSGASVLRGIGTVRQLSVTGLGGSDAQLGDLASDTATVSLAGGAKTTLRVAKQLTGTADGGSTIILVVQPTAQSVTTTGGSTVTGP